MKLGRFIKYDIVIQASANNGFIARVGCATLVFADDESLLAGLREYLDDPDGHEKEYNRLRLWGNEPTPDAVPSPGPPVEQRVRGTGATTDENMPQSKD